MLTIKDKPGALSVATMRVYFERAINDTPALKANTPLGTITVNGAFSHYTRPDTDTMWLGFALGMRAAERIKREETGPPANTVLSGCPPTESQERGSPSGQSA